MLGFSVLSSLKAVGFISLSDTEVRILELSWSAEDPQRTGLEDGFQNLKNSNKTQLHPLVDSIRFILLMSSTFYWQNSQWMQLEYMSRVRGGLELFWLTLAQSTSFSQGLLFIYSKEEVLFQGFLWSIFCSNYLRSGSNTSSGYTISCWTILWSNYSLSSVQYGGSPVMNSYNRTPMVQKSSEYPYPACITISGAIYSGLPQQLSANSWDLNPVLERPKSAIFKWPLMSTRMFSGFKSRQRMLLWWRNSMHRRISEKHCLAFPEFRLSCVRWMNSSPPGQQSVRKFKCLSDSNAAWQYIVQSLGSNCSKIFRSLRICSNFLQSEIYSLDICLRANKNPVLLLLTRYTAHDPPLPKHLLNSKSMSFKGPSSFLLDTYTTSNTSLLLNGSSVLSSQSSQQSIISVWDLDCKQANSESIGPYDLWMLLQFLMMRLSSWILVQRGREQCTGKSPKNTENSSIYVLVAQLEQEFLSDEGMLAELREDFIWITTNNLIILD